MSLLWKYRRKTKANKCFLKMTQVNYLVLTFCTLLIMFIILPCSNAQRLSGGLFPVIKDLSSFMPINTSSVCGLNGKTMQYCASSVSNLSLQSCDLRTCRIGCCKTCGSKTPEYVDIDKYGVSEFGVYVSADRRPDSDIFSSSKDYKSGFIRYGLLPPHSNFTFATWIKQSTGNFGTLIESKDSVTVLIKENTFIFTYKTSYSPSVINTLTLRNVIFMQGKWHHFAVVVCGYDMSLFIDGDVVRTEILAGALNPVLGSIRIGQSNGGNQFIGLMQDMKYYQKGLTNREVIEGMTGKIPPDPYPHCRCPETHPRLSINNPFYCTQNGRGSGGKVQRLSSESHLPEYLVDGEVITYWISEKIEHATITLDLKYSKLQVYLVSILFYSPPPQGIEIERSVDHGNTYIPWQYFATDCIIAYNMLNNGELPKPDSVNCLQIPSPKPSWETITFQPAEAGPNNKPQRPFGEPGCSDFYCSPKLMQFVQASNVRITLTGHAVASHPDHRYFAIRRIVVGGSCDCYGHATKCDFYGNTNPHPKYICQCDSRTFTKGEQCEQCMPLYRDKPFARGTILNANPCKKCECNLHANSCYYNRGLDTDANDRNVPGGGVCVGCKHNTMGRFCSNCKPLFYRPRGKLLNATDVCQPCDCVGPGVLSGQLDCQKDDSTVGIIAGQCKCKQYVTGRQCTECQSGFFKLSSTDPVGCTECQCNIIGTQDSDASCHISSGQCNCKANVIGVKCTSCKFGHYGLTSLNQLGCLTCSCNPLGSNQPDTCDMVTGQCSCKERFEGRACDRCKQGYFGAKCEPCSCDASGTEGGLTASCDQATGKCQCKLYVTGNRCDKCKTGFYALSASNPSGCFPCNCDNKGTFQNSGECNQGTGQCICKSQVTGNSCNLCKVGTYGLSLVNPHGCSKCNCSTRGTAGGDNTPQDQLRCTSNGECSCLSNVIGKKCDQCVFNFYWNSNGLGCLPCQCDQAGSISTSCNQAGYCTCKQNTGVAGRKCNECQPGYYGYSNGSCMACGCSFAGSVTPQCDGFGRCLTCKKNVQGLKCDSCKPGSSNLQGNNPYGCSGAPSEQGPPVVTSQTVNSLSLSWNPPDDPNGAILYYELFRNTSLIYQGNKQTFIDQSLLPFTLYSYHIIVYTSGGSAKSVDNLIHRTLTDIPKGVEPPVITKVQDRSVLVSWKRPAFPNGVITQYILKSITSDGSHNEHYTGLNLSYQVMDLKPFTVYSFIITACTFVGCQSSINKTISTRSAAPDSQPAPFTYPLAGGSSVLITWTKPEQPNGVIVFYDLFSREEPFVGQGNTVASGLNADLRNYTVTNRHPYTIYEFRIVSYTAQVKGAASSNWTRVRTLEGIPAGAAAIQPVAISLNSSSIDVTWNNPTQPNGIIKHFEIFKYENSSNYFVPILAASTPGIFYYVQIGNLTAYASYYISIKACNSVGCTAHSAKVLTTTKAAPPSAQDPPSGHSFNDTSITLSWRVPASPNGPLPLNYIVERMLPPFHPLPPHVDVGVHFPGFGYYRFPASLVPDSIRNQIEFYFKTRYLNGLLFFAASEQQEDILVVEFRDGCPWFVFDTESGAAAFTISKNTSFNDNKWHHVLLTRNSKDGRIVIDNTYEGVGKGFGTKNVIGQIANVFIGGLPDHFRILRKDGGSTTLTRMPFIGCIKGFKYKSIPLDFSNALENMHVSPLFYYCPHTIQGVHFKGGGYIVFKEGVFKGGKSFSIEFEMKTLQKSALIYFAPGENVYLALFIDESKLYLQSKSGASLKTYLLSPFQLCDGGWHDILITNKAQSLSAWVDGNFSPITTLTEELIITSQTFLGGMPPTVTLQTTFLSLLNSFSGCIKNLQIETGVLYQSTVHSHHNIDFSGCPTPSSNGVGCQHTNIVQIYDGTNVRVSNGNLETFSEYLYRVKSYHKNIPGFAVSNWIVLRSGEGDPKNLSSPTIISLLARSAILIWKRPDVSGGLIVRYKVHAYHHTWMKNTSKVVESSLLRTNLSNLSPASLYYFTVEAFTSSGSIESNTVIGRTQPAAPEGFSPAVVISYPTSFNVTWKPPSQPNGDILFYQVDIDGSIAFKGLALHKYIGQLKVYTLYSIKVYVCGQKGCAASQIDRYTGQLPPQGVVAPQLLAQGSHKIEVKWIPPKQLNGIIVRYEVIISLTPSMVDVISVFNGSASTYQTTVTNLKPGTLYYVRVKAFTEAGGTVGDASSIKTFESAPEDIQNPIVNMVNSSTLSVKILQPKSPNGVIIEYTLLKDDQVEFTSSKLPEVYLVGNLLPYTKHTFQVKVCTSQGCGFSNQTEAFTSHAPPVGVISLRSNVVNSNTIKSIWNAVAQPNGPLRYSLVVFGEFYRQPGVNYLTEKKSVVCFVGDKANVEVFCNQLLPFANYSVTVNATNDAGYVLSNTVLLSTPGDIPEGIAAPFIDHVLQFSVNLSWRSPSRPNGNIKNYTLFGLYPMINTNGYQQHQIYTGLSKNYFVKNLNAFTNYSLWIVVANDFGQAVSQKTNITTLEDVPSDFDEPKFSFVGSRSATVEISPPGKPNGIITQYLIYLNQSLINTTMEKTTQIMNLNPFTRYSVYVAVCTKVGCQNSSVIVFQTLQDIPEGMKAPILLANGSRSVVVRWSKPSLSNGIITNYIVQRRIASSLNHINVAKINAYSFIDVNVKPYKTYEYRIIAETRAGGAPSPYNSVRTAEGEPEWTLAPLVSALSSTSIYVKWSVPEYPNGNITRYFLKVANITDPVADLNSLEHTLNDLLSYVGYNVIVSACTIGGCGDSPSSFARTLPSKPKDQPAPLADALSNTSLRVRWREPIYPNGQILQYILYGRTIESLISQNISEATNYTFLLQTSATVYDHVMLGIFSLQQYKVTCVTMEGNVTSNDSLYYRTDAGIPTVGPSVQVKIINHTSAKISWSDPPIQQLKGKAVSYTVTYEVVDAPGFYKFGTFHANIKTVVVDKLRANTVYDFRVSVFNGAGTKDSEVVRAKTFSGIPEGFDRPEIYNIGSFHLRVYWTPPRVPNGEIKNYTIVINDVKLDTVDSQTNFHEQGGLKPYTDHIIKIQVCTDYSCILSDGTMQRTNPAVPTDLLPPVVTAVSATSINVTWRPPKNPNGLMSGYELHRRHYTTCQNKFIQRSRCDYVSCKIHEQLCGAVCYDPKLQVCCNTTLHDKSSQKSCCGDKYILRNSLNNVCCGGKFHKEKTDYQCCYGNYIQVPKGHVCCSRNDNVFVGAGTSCCDGVPFDENGSKKCLCGILYDKYPDVRQCCGDQIVSSLTQVCCGDALKGKAHMLNTNKTCCGTAYVHSATSLCCENSQVYFHYDESAKRQYKCCGTNQILASSTCCSTKGFNNADQVCADRSSSNNVSCGGSGKVCHTSQNLTAYCGKCDFDTSRSICYAVEKNSDHNNTCPTEFIEVLKNDRNPRLLWFVDTKLLPQTKYEYFVIAINTVGNVSTALNSTTTFIAGPEGISPPVAVGISSTQVSVTWSPPSKPNGRIEKYLLYRVQWTTENENLVYNGSNLSYLDKQGLHPYTAYLYTLSTCTNVCVNKSAESLTYTQQAIPTNVPPPQLFAIDAYSMRVNWSKPLNPNGIIVRYNISQKQDGKYTSIVPHNSDGKMMSMLVHNLKPYTVYTFRVEACSVIGCGHSPDVSERTLAAAPAAVELTVFILSSRTVHIEWNKPKVFNGILSFYVLRRNHSLSYNGTFRNFTDQTVIPGTYYTFVLEAHNSAGYSNSTGITIVTPISSPEGIPVPNLLAVSSTAVNVSWSIPVQQNGDITEYDILYQETAKLVNVLQNGLLRNGIVSGLKPFTMYFIRIRACTRIGCGVGNAGSVRTLEAVPSEQAPPKLMNKTSTEIQLKWKPPGTPNGNITSYKVERRGFGSVVSFHVGLERNFTDTPLIPFSSYDYRVLSSNQAGSAASIWVTFQTLEDLPDGISSPNVFVLNSTTVRVTWVKPTKPNGVIKSYVIRARLFSQVGQFVVRKCCISPNALSLFVSELSPATSYEFQVGASNNAGTGYSAYTIAVLKEAAPSEIPNLNVNTRPDGRDDGSSMMVYWNEPVNTNGIVTNYILYEDGFKVYEGSERQALIRRVTPYTNYTFRLSVCNSAGCTNGSKQILTSGEVTPRGQQAPSTSAVTATAVHLNWKPPLFANGRIILYQIIREQIGRKRKRRSDFIVFSTNNTHKDFLNFQDTGLQPYTTYRYKIRAVNIEGSVDSDWLIVTTSEAAPTGLSKLNAKANRGPVINIEWRTPTVPNGIIRFYNLYRNGSRIATISTNAYTDKEESLSPNTVYEYWVAACTAAGCTNTSSALVKTLASTPEEMLPPSLRPLSATRIKVVWIAPVVPNGDIKEYQLYLDGATTSVFEGYAFQYTVFGLKSFTRYGFTVHACTVQGCTKSKPSFAMTLEDIPENIENPNLFVLSSTAVEATWNPPKQPNGVILFYVLRRGGISIYNGTALRFIDRSVKPATSYTYTVSAFNSAGVTTSNDATSPPTNPSAPENVTAPILIPISSSSILATWAAPGNPNGKIIGYFILFDGNNIDTGLVTKYTATNLLPFTAYEFRVQACTTNTACTVSHASRERTLEAAPLHPTPPFYHLQSILHNSIRVLWASPRKPNGIIIKYELYRKYLNDTLVYVGPDTSFVDTDPNIQPDTTYYYKVVSYNSVGRVASPYSAVVTDLAPPRGVNPVIVQARDVADTVFSLRITEPNNTYGEIILYQIEVVGFQNITTNTTKSYITVTGLTPLTEYQVRLYACNAIGCGHSIIVKVLTKSTKPGGFDTPPTVIKTSSNEMLLSWKMPLFPNGQIAKYQVVLTLLCPQPSQPTCTAPKTLVFATLNTTYNVKYLFAYTVYSIKIRVSNQAGFTDSPSVNKRTLAEDPLVVQVPLVTISDASQNTVIVNWMNVFDLRSQLIEYTLYQNNRITYTGDKLSLPIPSLPTGTYTYKVAVETFVNGAKKFATSEEVSIAIGSITPTAGAQTSDEAWYQTVWFLALCVLAFILIIFLLVVCCCRYCRSNRTVYVRQREPLPLKSKYRTRVPSSMDGFSEKEYIKNPSLDRYNTIADDRKPQFVSSPQPSRVDFGPLSSMNESKLNDIYRNDDDFIWETNVNSSRDLDSGLYDESAMSGDDGEFDDIHTENGFVSVQQERVLFPDTHL